MGGGKKRFSEQAFRLRENTNSEVGQGFQPYFCLNLKRGGEARVKGEVTVILNVCFGIRFLAWVAPRFAPSGG